MKYLFLLLSGLAFCQNQISGIVVDEATKLPINAASVSNQTDYTITNEDGYFLFISNSDSLKISKLGYDDLNLTFDEFNSDTIFLSPKGTVLLDEATIVNYPSLMKNVYLNVEKNYPHKPFVDQFFLRTILKRNNEIYRFEDIQGKIKRNTLFLSQDIKTADFEFQILNQRKAGLSFKKNMALEIEFHSLKQLFDFFSSVFIDLKGFSFHYENIDENYVKVTFTPRPDFKNRSLGYYVIDKRDYSIKEYFIKTNPEFFDEIEFTKKQGFKFRTTDNELFVRYSKNTQSEKYYISDARIHQTLEVIERNGEKTIYNVENQLVNVKNADKEGFNSNIAKNRRLFDINFDYDEDFWKNQNQLLLTNELESFINSEVDAKEFKVISNFGKRKK